MDTIRVRVALVVVEDGRILLVPHYDTDAGPVQWNVPGGQVQFGEALYNAVRREFQEETGLEAELDALVNISEVIQVEPPYHSLTLTYRGRVTGGMLRAEPDHPYGDKTPRWFSAAELAGLAYHPPAVVRRALGIPEPTGH